MHRGDIPSSQIVYPRTADPWSIENCKRGPIVQKSFSLRRRPKSNQVGSFRHSGITWNRQSFELIRARANGGRMRLKNKEWANSNSLVIFDMKRFK